MSKKTVRLIQENAAKIVKMHQELKEKFSEKERVKSSEVERKWEEACHLFHSSYEVLAFTGGLTEGMALLKKGDSNSIENAIDFLECDPYFFRSGYLKEDILRYLSRVNLSEIQIKRLQEILLARVKSLDRRREFKSYCNFAKKIADVFLIEKINKIHIEADNDIIAWKTESVLRRLVQI